jgi:phosphoribosylanthranilate isomerase
MWVKVCGCRTEAGIDAAVSAGADAVGLIFAESRRRVAPKAARALAERVPSSVAVVGVVHAPTPETLRELLAEVPLDLVQLSGRMPQSIARLVPYLRTVYLGADDRLPSGRLPQAYALHLDRRHGQRLGGTGERVNLSAARRIVSTGRRVVLAGGLNAENVQQAIREVSPFGVDVASGVEVGGEQDPDAIFRFVRAAKGADLQ